MYSPKPDSKQTLWGIDEFNLFSIVEQNIKKFHINNIHFAVSLVSKKDTVNSLGTFKKMTPSVVTSVLLSKNDIDVFIVSQQDEQDYWYSLVSSAVNSNVRNQDVIEALAATELDVGNMLSAQYTRPLDVLAIIYNKLDNVHKQKLS